MTAQIVEISGQKMVVLPIRDYERLVDLAEERADVAAATSAEQRRNDGEEFLPADMVDRLLAGENPLRVWRNHRGLTQDALGQAVGVSKVMISKMELGDRNGSLQTWNAIAHELGVAIDDITPN
ncbi:helix-turn-helix transcriptional regulator [Sphingomonas sp. AX6]|uniref:helix-turn-helix transcriptional regulator n=1 Tax=Sphingomonas sp. AX6 TaxID=2653171 RepID=UPI0012F1FEF0|nr:helix-turn-helix transcriptional regulator [Sphingomonas sp. AX6]VXC50939.1 XRE family transcriptional regulator [Sphingomonas sp. AX6]